MELALTQLPVRVKEPNLEKDSAIVHQIKYGFMKIQIPKVQRYQNVQRNQKIANSFALLMMLMLKPNLMVNLLVNLKMKPMSLTASVTTKILNARFVLQTQLL
jgi:hypothetical protein